MAGEGQFFLQGEDTRAMNLRVAAGQQEDRLELTQLTGQRLHGGGRQLARIGKYRYAVTGQRPLGEYIELPVNQG